MLRESRDVSGLEASQRNIPSAADLLMKKLAVLIDDTRNIFTRREKMPPSPSECCSIIDHLDPASIGSRSAIRKGIKFEPVYIYIYISDKTCGISGETTSKFGQDSKMHFDWSRCQCIFTYLRGKPTVDTVVLLRSKRLVEGYKCLHNVLWPCYRPLRYRCESIRRRCKDAICQEKP